MVPGFGSDGSSGERVFSEIWYTLKNGAVPVSVPEKRFRFRFLKKQFRRFRFPVRFLSLPDE